VEPVIGATRVLVDQGATMIVGGHQAGADGRQVATLEILDKATGAVRSTWRGEAAEDRDAFAAAGAAVTPTRAVFVIAERALRSRAAGGQGGDRLRVLQVDGGQRPRPLFEITPDQAISIEDATITPMGERLLVTYTTRHPAAPHLPLVEDDYEAPVCTGVPITWAELRDARSGALIASQQLTGWTAPAATARGGEVLLGGGFMESCATELRAGVLALDADLQSSRLFLDRTLGWSEVRALSPAPGEATLIAAAKASRVDYRTGSTNRFDAYAPGEMATHYSGMLVRLAADGSASAPKLLDSGSNLYLSAADASRPDDIVLGGSLGGQAVVFRLSARAP